MTDKYIIEFAVNLDYAAVIRVLFIIFGLIALCLNSFVIGQLSAQVEFTNSLLDENEEKKHFYQIFHEEMIKTSSFFEILVEFIITWPTFLVAGIDWFNVDNERRALEICGGVIEPEDEGEWRWWLLEENDSKSQNQT